MFKIAGTAIAFIWAFFFSDFATPWSPYKALTYTQNGVHPYVNDHSWYGGVIFSIIVGFLVGFIIDKMIAKNKK